MGVIDETSAKKGDKTPGVQRQYLGCVGKLDNGIVTVHMGVARGRFQALLDADLFLPERWDADRERCRRRHPRQAALPTQVADRPGPADRCHRNGVRFDWLTFDEGYGQVPAFLVLLDHVARSMSRRCRWRSRVGAASPRLGGPIL